MFFIIWGWSSEANTVAELGQQFCTVCKQDRPFRITHTYRRFHVFWITILSWNTKYFYHCTAYSRGHKIGKREVHQALGKNPMRLNHRFAWAIPTTFSAILYVYAILLA